MILSIADSSSLYCLPIYHIYFFEHQGSSSVRTL